MTESINNLLIGSCQFSEDDDITCGCSVPAECESVMVRSGSFPETVFTLTAVTDGAYLVIAQIKSPVNTAVTATYNLSVSTPTISSKDKWACPIVGVVLL